MSFWDDRYHQYEKRDTFKNNSIASLLLPHAQGIIKSGKAPMHCSQAFFFSSDENGLTRFTMRPGRPV
jgi:hypothetical protein